MKTIPSNSEKKFNASLIPDLTATKERKSPLVLGIITVLGLASTVLSFSIKENLTDLSLFFLITGVGLLITSLLLLINKKDGAYYGEKSNKVKERSLEMNYTEQKNLCQLFKKFHGDKSNLDFRNNQGQIKVDFLISKDKKFASCQLFQYVPYEYKPMSDIYCFYDGETEELINAFAQYGLKV